eukprot:1151102-Pelagomonas_calceolata.AAC.1
MASWWSSPTCLYWSKGTATNVDARQRPVELLVRSMTGIDQFRSGLSRRLFQRIDMLAHTALMVLALLAAASAAQIPPQEDCQAKFEEMGTNSLLSQFQPCQRGVTEECCERVGPRTVGSEGQSIVGFTESAPLGGCLCHEHIFDELVKGINSNTLARLQQCGVPFAYGTGESQCPSFDQEDIGGEGDGDGDGGNDEEFMEEVVMDGEMWDQGARGDSSDKEKEEPSDKESTDYKDDDKEKKEVETSGGKCYEEKHLACYGLAGNLCKRRGKKGKDCANFKTFWPTQGVDDGKDAKVSSSPSSLPTQRGGNGYRGLFPGRGGMSLETRGQDRNARHVSDLGLF